MTDERATRREAPTPRREKGGMPAQEQDRQPGREQEMVPAPRYEGEAYRAAGKLEGKHDCRRSSAPAMGASCSHGDGRRRIADADALAFRQQQRCLQVADLEAVLLKWSEFRTSSAQVSTWSSPIVVFL